MAPQPCVSDWDDASMTLTFTLRPSTVHAAQYVVMTLVRQHAPTLRAVEDLRLLLDEVINHAAADDPTVTVAMTVHTTPDLVRGSIELRPFESLATGQTFRGLSDEITVTRRGRSMVIEFTTAWDQPG